MSRLIRQVFVILLSFSVVAACLPANPTGNPTVATSTPGNTTVPSETGAPTNTAEPAIPTVATSIRQSDGMAMAEIPAGKFMMGSEEGEPDEGPVHEVYLDTYSIDLTEITNGMYALCVEAGSCRPPMETGSFSRTSYYGNASFAEYPVIYVDWSMADAYCAWAGARLPTEAEWENAARGETARTYPWGEAWDVRERKRLNFADKNNPETASDLIADDGYGDTAPVGSFEAGKSPYGVYDLAGNVWEWVADGYDPLYYLDSPANNPRGPAGAAEEISMRVLRGGSWVAANEDVFRTSNRNGLEPSKFSSSIGFRCAR